MEWPLDPAQTMLVRFYDPEVKGADEQGRTLDYILSWNDATLERCHNYIQTLFPLPEPSGVFDNVPLVTMEIRQQFKNRPELRENLITAFNRMLSFYGLEYQKVQGSDDSVDWNPNTDLKRVITQAENWETAAPRWVVPRNHNHLRITRIIRSLRVLGCKEEAHALHCFLEEDKDVLEIVSKQSRDFWTRAADNKLWLPPHELDPMAAGTVWLAAEKLYFEDSDQ